MRKLILLYGVCIIIVLTPTGAIGCAVPTSEPAQAPAAPAPASTPPALTPAPTPIPTPAPTPEPAPPATLPPEEPVTEPPALLEIRGVTDYFDMGYYTVVGEVFNATNSNIEFVEVVATFYNEAGTVIGTDFTFTELDIILPGDTSPFEISSYPDKIQPTSYKLSYQYNETTEQPFAGLSIKSHSASIDDMGFHEIVGEVENNSTIPAEFVMIVVTYYNSSEDVIGTDFTFTDIDVIQAGDTAPFELSSYPLEINPASYKLQVQGERA